MSFASLGLSEALVRAIEAAGYTQPTPVQQRVSPLPMEIGNNPQFLAVRRGAGMDLLVQRFAAELRRFKQEPAYAQLLARYAVEPMSGKTIPSAAPQTLQPSPAGTAGQRESSAM